MEADYVPGVGIDLADVERALELAELFDQVFASVGFHPHNAKDVDEQGLQRMEEFAGHPKVVAYGEIGLDFFRGKVTDFIFKLIIGVDFFQQKIATADGLF